jgi:hypothetical protein
MGYTTKQGKGNCNGVSFYSVAYFVVTSRNARFQVLVTVTMKITIF